MCDSKTFRGVPVKLFPVKYYYNRKTGAKTGRAAVTTEMTWAKSLRAELEQLGEQLGIRSSPLLVIIEYALPTVMFNIITESKDHDYWRQHISFAEADIPVGMTLRVEGLQSWIVGDAGVSWQSYSQFGEPITTHSRSFPLASQINVHTRTLFPNQTYSVRLFDGDHVDFVKMCPDSRNDPCGQGFMATTVVEEE